MGNSCSNTDMSSEAETADVEIIDLTYDMEMFLSRRKFYASREHLSDIASKFNLEFNRNISSETLEEYYSLRT